MNEWLVVTVLVTVAGLVGTILAPVLRLNSSITRLTSSVTALEKNLEALTSRNTQTHDRIWRHSEEQDGKIAAHETRLSIIEQGVKI